MAGRMRRAPGHHAQPRGGAGRRRARADPGTGSRPRPPGRHGPPAQHGQGHQRGEAVVTTAATTTVGGQRRRLRPDPEHRTVERRRIDGTVIDTISLDPHIFGVEPNAAVLHQVITAQLAGARAGTQSTRTRAEVAGGGAKPFRQKGTGRARQGSIRSPQWSGGGVALGPKPRSYRQRTPKKMIRLALHSALSDRAAEGKVAVVDEWSFPAPKTKDAVAALAALETAGPRPGGARARRRDPGPVLRQPGRGPDHPVHRAQRLRRPQERLGGVHRRHAPGEDDPGGRQSRAGAQGPAGPGHRDRRGRRRGHGGDSRGGLRGSRPRRRGRMPEGTEADSEGSDS